MEPRKRPYSDDEEDVFTAKKRALTGFDDALQVNGISEQEPTEKDNLELFRKEAIFRRMRHYSREHERSLNRIAELEQRKQRCETGLAAMSACWNQLVAAIRFLFKPEDTNGVNDDMFSSVLLASYDENEEYSKTLERNLNSTRILINRLVKAVGDEHENILSKTFFEDFEKATAECNTLRSEVKIIRAQLQDSEEQKDRYHAALLAAETRLDRAQSRTILAMQLRTEIAEESDSVPRESNPKACSPEASMPPNNGDSDATETEILREQIYSRDVKITALERETALLRDEKIILESELKSLPDDMITETPQYKALLRHASFIQASLIETRSHVTRLHDEIAVLRTSRKEWEEVVIVAANQANQELKTMLAKRDADNARLRDQREQHAAELNERRHKDSIKYTSIQELKALVDSRSERIAVLESELRRYKGQLAANASNEDLVLFFTNGNTEEVDLIESLKNRIISLENRNSVLEQSLLAFQKEHPNVFEQVKADTEALRRLAGAEAELAKYKSVYGDSSTLSPDLSSLSKQLRQKEEELQKLRLLDVQHAQAEKSLYAELDKLSAAWEALDRQVKSKVFDLVAMEDRLTKIGLDKAKSDNKFYAVMRDKEAVETERKNLSRNMEKQVKVVERLVEVEKNLTNQLNAAEKEICHLKSVGSTYRDKIDDLTEELSTWIAKVEGEKKRVAEMRSRYAEREKSIEMRKSELQKLEDNLLRTKKGLEQKKKDTLPTNHNASSSEQELLQLLKCACRKRFRNTLITKCMHTFCKDCIDARIATRQRKCPACGVAFSQTDVLAGMFFQ